MRASRKACGLLASSLAGQQLFGCISNVRSAESTETVEREGTRGLEGVLDGVRDGINRRIRGGLRHGHFRVVLRHGIEERIDEHRTRHLSTWGVPLGLSFSTQSPPKTRHWLSPP